jgi:hypothetical protein
MGHAKHHAEEARSKTLDQKFVANCLKEYTIKTHLWTEEAKLEHIKDYAKSMFHPNKKQDTKISSSSILKLSAQGK